jgi:hypothetical protein
MNRITMPAALSAIALLAACNSGAASNNSSTANSSAPANTSVAAPGAATPAPGAAPAATGPVDQAFIQGHWSPNAACGETITFEADGTARVSDDPRPGRWELSGDTLTVTPPEGSAQPTQVARAGDNLVATQNGQAMTMTRCDAPAAATDKG